MIRDKFIAAKRHCWLWRHLNGVPPETPIWEIVDSCRVWESHSDREPNSEDDQDRDSRPQSSDPRKLGCPRTGTGGLGNRLASASFWGGSLFQEW